MPIFYQRSIELETLARQLSQGISKEQKESPLSPPIIVVPNQNMRKWLQLHIAKISGIATNIRFVFLEKILEEYFTYRAGLEYNPFQSRFPSPEESQRIILNHLVKYRDDSVEKPKKNKSIPDYSLIDPYLYNLRRLFQLSKKLALYFKDYELNRPEWIENWWKEDRTNQASNTNPYYHIQKNIYQEEFLNKEESFIPKTLPQWLLQEGDVIFKKPSNNSSTTSIPFSSIHFFCLSNLADGYWKIFEKLSENILLNFYQFTSREIHSIQNPKSKAFSFSEWAKPQIQIAENLERLGKEVIHTSERKANKPKGLDSLHRILSSEEIQDRIPLNPRGTGTLDNSVRIWNAPSAYRELEAVANDILYKMSNQDHLSYIDFAVLVTDINQYRPAIEWVFDGGVLLESTYEDKEPSLSRKKIPYALTDIQASDSSLLYRSMMDFFTICTEPRISKSAFFSLLRNPIFTGMNDLDTIQELEELINLTGTQYEEESLLHDLPSDPYLLSSGINRIRLSSVLNTDRQLNDTLSTYNDTMLAIPSEESAVKLNYFWNKIIDTKNSLLDSLNLESWDKNSMDQVLILLDSFFIIESGSQDQYLYQIWKEAVLRWVDFPLRSWEVGMEEPGDDGLNILKFVTEEVFSSQQLRKGEYLTGGVAISLLQPMRPIPFKHIYILGLGEGKFPGAIDRSPMNLRNLFPEQRDISRREIQESLFWEALHSAQESITLSYVGKNLLEDKVFEPCSSLFEIMRSLSIDSALELPIHPYSRSYSNKKEDWESGLISYDYSRSWLNKSSTERREIISSQFQDPLELEKKSSSLTEEIISISNLAKFIQDPFDSFLKKRLGMYMEEEEVPEDSNEEKFFLNPIEDSILIKEVLPILLPELVNSDPPDWSPMRLESILDPILVKAKKRANFPLYEYGVVSKENLLSYLKNITTHLRRYHDYFRGGKYYSTYTIGDTGLKSNTVFKVTEPVILEINDVSYTLQGEWDHIIEKDGDLNWIYPKRISTDIKYDSYNNYHKDYWKDHALPFFTMQAFNLIDKNLTIYSLPTRLDLESTKQSFLPRYRYNTTIDSKSILTKALIEYTNDSIQLFPRLGFLKYYSEEYKLKGENLWTDEESWKEFCINNLESLKDDMSQLTKIYPNMEDLLKSTNLTWAVTFFKPMVDSLEDLK